MFDERDFFGTLFNATIYIATRLRLPRILPGSRNDV
jgi:hypothetical protein